MLELRMMHVLPFYLAILRGFIGLWIARRKLCPDKLKMSYKAIRTHGMAWRNSCVEFFIKFYGNFQWNSNESVMNLPIPIASYIIYWAFSTQPSKSENDIILPHVELFWDFHLNLTRIQTKNKIWVTVCIYLCGVCARSRNENLSSIYPGVLSARPDRSIVLSVYPFQHLCKIMFHNLKLKCSF